MTPPSPEELRARDASARRVAQEEFRRPVVLVAGAGTGKTTVLVARIVCWCLGPGWDKNAARLEDGSPDRVGRRVLERLGAITFTEKAAAEMGTRVAEAFARLAEGRAVIGLERESLDLAEDALRDRAGVLRRNIDALQASTIHAFCRRLLATHALEAGLHPTFEVDADQSAMERIVRQVVLERLPRALANEEDDDLLRLLVAGVTPERIVEAVRSLATAGVEAETLAHEPFAPEAIERAARRLISAVESLREILTPAFEGKKLGRSPSVKATWDAVHTALRPAAPLTSCAALLEWLAPFLETRVLDTLKNWARGEYKKIDGDLIGASQARVTGLAETLHAQLRGLDGLDPELMESGLRILRPLLAAVEERRRRRGVVTFGDLLAGTRRLLDASPAVCAHIRKSFDLLLVDEFQDTDPVQYLIVERLALEGPEDERPGLFLVGDPKQSIYAWRGADLGAFEAFLTKVKALEGRDLALYVNYRSTAPILDEVSRILGATMIEEPGLQPRFEPLVPADSDAPAAAGSTAERSPVEHWISWTEDGPRTRSDAAYHLEAAAVAHDLGSLHRAGDLRWKDAALLLRTRTPLETYLEALRAAGVPYVVAEDRNYYRRREIQEALAHLTAILDPHDHVALVATLRSAAVGVPDAALIPLWREGLPHLLARLPSDDPADHRALEVAVARAAETVPASVPGIERIDGWPQALRAFVGLVEDLRRSFHRESADRFVDRFRQGFGSELLAAGRYLGALRHANLEKFHRELEARLQALDEGPQELLRELRRASAGEIQESEAAGEDDAGDAVRVMTVHQAKGLTFGHTYVVALHQGRRSDSESGLNVPDEVTADEAGVEMRLFGQRSLGYGAVVNRRERQTAAEAVRLLYVALTRSKRRLVMAGCLPDPAKVTGEIRSGRLIDLVAVRGGVPPEFTNAEDASGSIVDEQGIRWRHLGRTPPDGLASLADADATAIPFETLLAEGRSALARVAAATEREEGARTAPLGTALSPAPDPWGDAPDEDVEERAPLGPSRDAAAHFGTLVHALIEHLELGGTADRTETDALRLARRLPQALADPRVGDDLATELLRWTETFLRSELLGRLRRLAASGDLIARELPLILAPSDPREALGALQGSVDLVHRDPDSGEWVIVDFKTRRLEDPAAAPEAATAHAPQLGAYARALGKWLGPDVRIRQEVWFVSHDLAVVLEADGTTGRGVS